MKILFMGTPSFAVSSLKALLGAGHEVCGVFSQPDKPVGRHQNKLQPTPVKELALAHNIPVFQPVKLRDGTALAQIQELAPELIVVAAYGRFLPDDILALPPKGCINVHSSLLPKYRGAAPINWAILNGETETGVTIMHMAHDMDAGDIILQRATPIGENEDAAALYDRLAVLGGELLVEAVAQIEAGTASRVPQDHTQAVPAPMLSKELSPVDWSRSAVEIHNQVRGLFPWPAATAELDGVGCKLLRTALVEETTELVPGSVIQADKRGLKLACGGGSVLEIVQLQPNGKKAMPATAFLAGHPIERVKSGE